MAYVNHRGIDIAQYYVDLDGERFRLRETYEHPGKMFYDKTYKETIANGVNTERVAPLDAQEFNQLASKAHRMIGKRRIIVPHEELKWEIDIFNSPKRLVIAEIELPSIDHPLVLPDFIREVLIMEITGMKQFNNYALADPFTH